MKVKHREIKTTLTKKKCRFMRMNAKKIKMTPGGEKERKKKKNLLFSTTE